MSRGFALKSVPACLFVRCSTPGYPVRDRAIGLEQPQRRVPNMFAEHVASATSPPLEPQLFSDTGDEPRILDTDLAERLGFEAPRQIRELIQRNEAELRTYGSLSCRTTNPSRKGGRPGRAFWLTEGQALVICALSRTPRAAAVRKLVIEVFMAWRAERDRQAPPLPKPMARLEHRIAITPTNDPELMRIVATLPVAVAAALMDALTSYERDIAAGLRRPAH